MNMKRFMVAFVAAYAVYQVGGFLIHAIWLDPVYEDLKEVFRPREQMDSMAWMFFITSAVMTAAFCYIFTRGYENRGVGEGVRYGLLMGLFFMVMQSFDAHVVYPLPMSLAIKWFVSGMVLFMLMGIAVALVYRSGEA